MLIDSLVGLVALLVVLVAAVPAHRTYEHRRHERALREIARLEVELGMRPAPFTQAAEKYREVYVRNKGRILVDDPDYVQVIRQPFPREPKPPRPIPNARPDQHAPRTDTKGTA